MICSLINKSSIYLLADLTDGNEKMLGPGQILLYEDTVAYPTDTTWALVEGGLFEDRDHGDRFHVSQLLYDVMPRMHSWVAEGF